MYDIASITSGCAGGIPWQMEIHDLIDSTNDRARELARGGAPHGTIVIADRQSGGHGRFQRAFYSPAGSGIYASIVLRPDAAIAQTAYITPMLAVAVARAIEACADVRARIKWVNDVYIEARKVCGILCVSGLDGAGKTYIVAGIGINVGRMEFPEPLSAIAGSVSNAAGKIVSRDDVLMHLLNEISALYPQLEEGAFMTEYVERSNVVGRDVRVLRGDESFTARAERIDPVSGALIVRTERGEIELSSGEVSLKFL